MGTILCYVHKHQFIAIHWNHYYYQYPLYYS